MKALGVLSVEGNIKQSIEACRILTELKEPIIAGHQADPHPRHEGSAAVSWGNVFTTDEYQSDGLFIGALASDCIDFGGNLKLPTILKQKLRAGEEIETKKCTILALAAGVEWVSQGRPKRCPSRRRIDVLASGLRLDEFMGAEQAMGRSMGETTDVAIEIRSICRDALTADHERDYQALGLFLLPSIWKYLACEVVVVEIRARVGSVFHTYPACPVENESIIFFIAHQGRMMWGEPTAATSSAMGRDWRTNAVTTDSDVIHRVVSWKQRLGECNTELDGNTVGC